MIVKDCEIKYDYLKIIWSDKGKWKYRLLKWGIIVGC